jgi:hypothetical protein
MRINAPTTSASNTIMMGSRFRMAIRGLAPSCAVQSGGRDRAQRPKWPATPSTRWQRK